jgi:hypothetical protein
MSQILKVIVALLLACVAVALVLYGILLIGAAASGSSDTAPSALIGIGVLLFVIALVPGGLAWALVRPRPRDFYRD